MKHAFIMDPLEGVKPWKDTSYFLMLAAYQRGHEVCYLDQRDLYLDHDQLMAKVKWLQVNDDHDTPFEVIAETTSSMANIDVVWLRTDPPFDRRYFYTTLLLDFLPSKVKVVNDPQGVRDWNEKLSAIHFPQFTPQTFVSNDVADIKAFAGRHDRITLKPVDGFGGKGIFFYRQGEDDAEIHKITHQGKQWVIAQEYLPEAEQGDKRILVVEGEPIGAILRVHAPGQELNNLDMGGEAVQVELDEYDLAICAAIKPKLLEMGVFFVGIDVIGGKLIEINVTSPTGLQELSKFSGIDHHHNIIQRLEA
ncbi:MAG: glutathione synthase [Arenicellales bacterium]